MRVFWGKLVKLLLVFYVSLFLANLLFQKFDWLELFLFDVVFTCFHLAHYYLNRAGLRKLKELDLSINNKSGVDWGKRIDEFLERDEK